MQRKEGQEPSEVQEGRERQQRAAGNLRKQCSGFSLTDQGLQLCGGLDHISGDVGPQLQGGEDSRSFVEVELTGG